MKASTVVGSPYIPCSRHLARHQRARRHPGGASGLGGGATDVRVALRHDRAQTLWGRGGAHDLGNTASAKPSQTSHVKTGEHNYEYTVLNFHNTIQSAIANTG